MVRETSQGETKKRPGMVRETCVKERPCSGQGWLGGTSQGETK